MAEGDKPIKGVEGFHKLTTALAVNAPRSLWRSKRSRRGLQQLTRRMR